MGSLGISLGVWGLGVWGFRVLGGIFGLSLG